MRSQYEVGLIWVRCARRASILAAYSRSLSVMQVVISSSGVPISSMARVAALPPGA
jgi:hypothetical protein